MSGSDLFTGTLDILILNALRREALHGYAIGRQLRNRSESVLDVEEGALYPALHRLEAKALLASKWGKSETGRRAKFYELTSRGEKALKSMEERWRSFSGAVNSLLGEGEA